VVRPQRRIRQLDRGLIAGIIIALAATVAGIAATGVRLTYFLQPTGALIVVGGTLGVLLITTPGRALENSCRRILRLARTPAIDRTALIDEIIGYLKASRSNGLLSLQAAIPGASNTFLREMLTLLTDLTDRPQFRSTLETKLRLRERQGEADAKALEVAGGFAPTLGVLGTVVGLIDVLRQFSDLTSVAYGLGTAFVSTIYGLALANLVLLPAAHRIRASVAETFDLDELMLEGGLGIFDGLHPTLLRERLNCFLREAPGR
jgi:chemotaxis protein MotA